MALVLKKLFETPYFRITVVLDAETVELCGALKVLKLNSFTVTTAGPSAAL